MNEQARNEPLVQEIMKTTERMRYEYPGEFLMGDDVLRTAL